LMLTNANHQPSIVLSISLNCEQPKPGIGTENWAIPVLVNFFVAWALFGWNPD